MKVLTIAVLIWRRNQIQQRSRRWIDPCRRNLIVGEGLTADRIEHPTECRQIAATLGDRRHGRVRVEGVARMVAGVIQEEERSRHIQQLADDQRTAERRTEPLLQIVRLRCLAIQRVRRRIERRRVEALKHVAANLVAAAAAPERSARTAGPSRTERASTKPTRSARSACSSRRTRRTRRTEGAVPESVAEAVGEL